MPSASYTFDNGKLEVSSQRPDPLEFGCSGLCLHQIVRRGYIFYRDGLAIFDRLVKADPGNADGQSDLAVSFSKLAPVHRQSGDNAKALDALRQGQAIMSRLTQLSGQCRGPAAALSVFEHHLREERSLKQDDAHFSQPQQ
jgi:hypothetical protein